MPPIEVEGGPALRSARDEPGVAINKLFLSVAAQVHEEVYFQHRCENRVPGGVESVFVDRTGLAGKDIRLDLGRKTNETSPKAMWNEAKREPEAVRMMLQTLLRDVVAEDRFMLALAGLGQEPVPRYRGLVLGLKQEMARAGTSWVGNIAGGAEEDTVNVEDVGRAGAALASAGGAFLEGVLEETLANILTELREEPGALSRLAGETVAPRA